MHSINYPCTGNQALTVVEKLQRALARAKESGQRAAAYANSKDAMKAGRALVALGLCQQAKEQIAAACHNLGFSIDSLLNIDEKSTSAQAKEQALKLKSSRAAVVKLLVQKLHVLPEAAFISMQTFADESAVMAAIMLCRAEEYLG